MYEAELSKPIGRIESVPADIRERFAESYNRVESRTLLPWGEHCTECNWPTCYTSCELYTPRQDGACRLFAHGMVRISVPVTFNGYLLEIRFKRWGKLWASGHLRLLPVSDATAKERSNIRVGGAVRRLPMPPSIKARALRKFAFLRRRAAERPDPDGARPDWFLFECYNPNDRTIDVTLTIRPHGGELTMAYLRKISLPPGFTRDKAPFGEVARCVDTEQQIEVEIVPNEADDTVLYFGALDFVKDLSASPGERVGQRSRTWKCIVWDLDNTLWDGILIEDGIDKLRIRQRVVDIIKETDRRGILHSVASKNNHEDAMRVLSRYGLDRYFLHPQINWDPKSRSLARIVRLLNIGADSVAFVDDQPFEREEVRAAMPQVAVIDAADCGNLPDRSECQVPVTEDSRKRRLMYQQQEKRASAAETYEGDYKQFLKDCDIRLQISPLSADNLERVYELAQRTNQMNFSGNRYPREQLQEIIQTADHNTYVMSCADRFGRYGIVGFALVDTREPRLLDLMFSCRIQNKRVEHAFLSFLLSQFVGEQARDFYANYRPTPKNAPSGRVFDEMGFEQIEDKDGVRSLAFRRARPIPADGIIAITTAEAH